MSAHGSAVGLLLASTAVLLGLGAGPLQPCSSAASTSGSQDAGGTEEAQASTQDAGAATSPDAAPGNLCAVNRDCVVAERCECGAGDCACKPGARGSGQSGVTPCADGNDCASSVCVEGPAGAFYCSGECATQADCKGKLPRCLDVSFVGRICVRDPDAG